MLARESGNNANCKQNCVCAHLEDGALKGVFGLILQSVTTPPPTSFLEKAPKLLRFQGEVKSAVR